MKGIWRTNPGGDAMWPPWKKMHDRGVTDFYVPSLVDTAAGWKPNKNEVNPAYKAGVNSQGFGYRIFSDPRWIGYTDPAVYAKACADEVGLAGGVQGYMFDIEYHNPSFVKNTILEYRKWVPKGPIAWTLEPHQGGWFTQELVNVLNNDINLVVVPQNYYGDMTPYDVAPYTNLRNDIINRGVKPARVKVFYDVNKPVPSDWDGCLYHEEGL